MALGWLQMEGYPFACFALFERFQIRYVCQSASGDAEIRRSLAVALAEHPTVAYAFFRRCPECAPFLSELQGEAPGGLAPGCVREAELALMHRFEDFVVYCYPELMDTHCDFIAGWNQERLYELADLTGKVVLDVGSGSGRLALAAAKRARHVYASEPVAMLRESLRDRILRERIGNMTVVDGMADCLPYPDGSFDVVMSGHVIGDDLQSEIAEMTRVTKNGGWILDCPGEDARKRPVSEAILALGWEPFHYISVLGGDVYRYRVRVVK